MTPERATPSGPRCPRCQRGPARRIALYGSQLMTSQFRCDACGQLFEALRGERPDARPQDAPPRGVDPGCG